MDKKVLSGSTNHRIKRETVTEEQSVYVVSSDGQDVPGCLNSAESNVTCGSITYVINERCSINSLLAIRIGSYTGTQVLREPLQNVSSIAQAYPCRVQLEGIVASNGTKPVVSLNDQASRKDHIFSMLLKRSMQSCIPESMPGFCEHLPKLEMINITLENMLLDNYGHKISFTNVYFYEFGLISPANSTHGCLFYCRGCLFTLHPMKIPKSAIKSFLKFEECVLAEIIMEEIKLYSTEIQVSFTNKLLANFTDVELTRTLGQNDSSKMTFQQIDEFTESHWESPAVEFTMENIKCSDNKPDGSMITLHFSNFISNRSMVLINNAIIVGSSSFLEYIVDAGAETSTADHHIKLSDLNITNNQGKKEIISVTHNAKGTIILEKSLLNGNGIESRSMVFMSTTGGTIYITNCVFSGNHGYNRGVVHITSRFHYPASVKINDSSFVNNTAGKIINTTGYGGAVYLESKSVELTVTEGTFTSNKANKGGALMIFVPDISEGSLDSVSTTPAVTQPNPIVQPAAQQTFSQDNITESTTDAMLTTTSSSLAFPVDSTTSYNVRVNISFTTFSENYAFTQGGGILFKGEGHYAVAMNSVKFESNSAHWGSGMIVDGNDGTVHMSLTLCEFLNNTWKAYPGQNENQCLGGAISIHTNIVERILMSENSLLQNTGIVGGALAVCSNQVQSLMIRYTNVEGNVAKDSNLSNFENSGFGGGFFIKILGNSPGISKLNITHSTAKGNTGNRGGGFLRVEVENEAMLNIHIKASTFTGNQAELGYGGAISLHRKTQFIHQSENPQLFTVNGCLFELNSGDEGGAISVKTGPSDCEIKFVDTTFKQNTGHIWGGALFIKYDPATENNNPFAIELRFNTVYMVENRIENPRGREGAGGAAYISFYPSSCFFSVTVEDSNIRNNSAPNSGGGLYVLLRPYNSKTDIIRSNFTRNMAGHGGAMKLYLTEEKSSQKEDNEEPFTFNISNCAFWDNTADHGGAIFQANEKELNESILGFIFVTRSTFSCCNEDIYFDTRNGTFIFSTLIAHLNEVSILEISEAEERSCSVPGIMIENYMKPMSIISVSYFCEAARVVYEYNRKLINDTYTYDSFLNGRKVDGLYSVNLGCGNCQEHPYRLGNGNLSLSKVEQLKTDENHYIESLFGIHTLKSYPCRVCPFGGKCYLGKINARPNYWGYKDKNDIFNLSVLSQRLLL